MACQKVCKQGRDDTKVKVNIQCPSLHLYHTSVSSKKQHKQDNLYTVLQNLALISKKEKQ